MKTLLLTLSALFILTSLSAQKIELSVQASTGLFHYSGRSTESTSFFNAAGSQGSYTNNPYGNKNGFGFGGALQAQFVNNSGFIFGLQAGYDAMKSKVDINQVYILQPPVPLIPGGLMTGLQSEPAKGESYLKTQYINLNPYVGYRFKIKNVNLDLMPGIDLGIVLNTHENGKAVGSLTNTTYETDLKRGNNLPIDLRLKFGVAAMYKRYGITASYAHGVINYESGVIGDASYEAYSNLLRLGILYRIL